MAVMQWLRRLALGAIAAGYVLAAGATALAAETIPSCSVTGSTVSCGVTAVQPTQFLTWLSIMVGIACAAVGILMAFNLVKIIMEMQGADERRAPEVMHKFYRFGAGALLFFGMSFFFGFIKGTAALAGGA